MYSIFCAFAVGFIVVVVPETKGKTLDEIAKLFAKNEHELHQATPKYARNSSITIVLNGVKCEHCGMLPTTNSTTESGRISPTTGKISISG